jgi:hypothetical protein
MQERKYGEISTESINLKDIDLDNPKDPVTFFINRLDMIVAKVSDRDGWFNGTREARALLRNLVGVKDGEATFYKNKDEIVGFKVDDSVKTNP